MLATAPRPWTSQARCVGRTDRERDWWSPDDELPEDDQGFQHHLARRVCSECPVRLACASDALSALDRLDEQAMRGGLTPAELVQVAKSLGMKWRREAQCGSRSKYVAGCRCDDCRDAHRVYEHERRLQLPRKPKPQPAPPTPPPPVLPPPPPPRPKPVPRAPEFCGRCWLEVTAVGTCGCDL